MKIYRMTATFGKLEHATLTLEEGLNVIHAPNEWGKSTWCAFLMAMLYGLDTRAKTTKAALADKERYTPWSGKAMAGRIDLCWQGRDITIERTTKGRIPMGEFRAYETETGIPVPELSAANCGQLLVGVEQSVFRRAGFIRLPDLPVTADEALRSRLNALVTTGDESGDAERLEKGLKELKNRCRYNRSGLIPQAEARREELEKKYREQEALQLQSGKIKARLGEVKSWIRELENHRDALAYAESEADAARVAQAQESREAAEKHLLELETLCARLPSQEETEKKIQQLRQFQRQWESARMEEQMLPRGPEAPELPAPFAGMPLPHGREMAREDAARCQKLQRPGGYLLWLILSGVFVAAAALAVFMDVYLAAAVAGALAVLALIPGIALRKKTRAEILALETKYGSRDPQLWCRSLDDYELALADYKRRRQQYNALRGDLDQRLAELDKQRQLLCGEQSAGQVLELWQQNLRLWEQLRAARRETQKAQSHYEALRAMARPARHPRMEDTLCYSREETNRLLEEADQEQQRLLGRLGQYRGRMETLGDPQQLLRDMEQLDARLRKLEAVYAAAQLGLDTLNRAKLELQRRFAPRISQRAQQLLTLLTDGRYDRLTLGEDFRLRAGAEGEDILQDALWRSDGTVDQLYLALRLAVAEELTPEAPLVLDDAFVRFDDDRLAAAMKVLKEMAACRQIILFSCQRRERESLF